MLRPVAGRPLIEHVYQRAAAAEGLTRVVVLTDDARIQAAVEAFGGAAEMTPVECASGTDRIAWAARDWPEDVVINVQGDEPLIEPADIARIARHLIDHPEDPIATLAAPASEEAYDDPHAVKVVFDRSGRALYFSRAPIPYRRDVGETVPHRHIGLYGYQRRALLEMATLPRSPLEIAESLEQLRALENGLDIRVLLTAEAMPGVDTMQDLERVEALLRTRATAGANDNNDRAGGG
jgi:3-deoxy-D-manno-octulosonate cytidylyltransferase